MSIASKRQPLDQSAARDGRYGFHAVNDRIMLQLARMLIIVMLSIVGFLLNGYVNAMNRVVDNMALSIDKISDTQEQLAIMMARMDVTVRAVDQRTQKTETRLDNLVIKKLKD